MTRRAGRGTGWRGAEVFGVLLVIAGIYWLLAEAGLFFWLSWQFLWPVILIGLGVWLVASRATPPGGHVDSAIPREGATQLDLNASFGGGRLRLEGGSTELVEARSTRADLRSEVRRSGSAAMVRLRQYRAPWGFWWGGTDWSVRLPSDVPTNLRVTGGAGELDLDLSSVQVVRGTVQIGAANARLVLPRPRGDVELRVSAGAASLSIVVPLGVEARISNSGGLVAISGRTETPGYATATDRVSVRVTGGASSISVL